MKRTMLCILAAMIVTHAFAQPLTTPSDRSMEALLTTEIPRFLSADSPQAMTTIVARVICVIVQQADHTKRRAELAQCTGALIGASGTNAPLVAAAIVNAAGTNCAGVVMSAIAISAPTNMTAQVRAAAIRAAPDGFKSVAQAAMVKPEQPLDKDLKQIVLDTARFLRALQSNWDPVRSKPTRDLLADTDGGEPPSSRKNDRTTPSGLSEEN